MKKVILLVLCASTVLTGCKKSEEAEYVIEETQDVMDFFTQEEGSNIFPEGMTEDGRQYFGNGYSNDSRDLISQLERLIWGDMNEED